MHRQHSACYYVCYNAKIPVYIFHKYYLYMTFETEGHTLIQTGRSSLSHTGSLRWQRFYGRPQHLFNEWGDRLSFLYKPTLCGGTQSKCFALPLVPFLLHFLSWWPGCHRNPPSSHSPPHPQTPPLSHSVFVLARTQQRNKWADTQLLHVTS